MERLPRQTYTKEFREQAVRLVLEEELTIPEAARRLAMSDKTLANWVFLARHGRLAGLGETRRPICPIAITLPLHCTPEGVALIA